MKTKFLLYAFFTVLTLWTATAQAQSQRTQAVENALKKNGKYAILVQNAMHFMAAAMTGEEYKAKHKNIEFEIVLIGPIVKDLAEKAELKPVVEKALDAGIRIVVCEFAMKKLGVEKSQYNPNVETTANGFTYIFGLQEMGFKTLTL